MYGVVIAMNDILKYVIVNGFNSQVDMDLMDMVDLTKQNDGYKYLLVCINIFILSKTVPFRGSVEVCFD